MENNTSLNSKYLIFSKLAKGILVAATSTMLLTGLTACSRSTGPQFYTLTTPTKPLISNYVRVIEVLPVGIPERLNRPLLVIQDGQGKSEMLDNSRWTSTLGAELRDGLSASLQQKLGAVDRYTSGMAGGKTSYRIATDFSRFDIVENSKQNHIVVAVAWIIKRETTNQSTDVLKSNNQLNCRMDFNYPIQAGDKIPEIVNASRQSLNRVSDAIAASVISFENNQKPAIQGIVCS